MKQSLNDRDRIEDLDGRIRKIPGLVDIVVADLNSRLADMFGDVRATTPDNIQLWLNCRSRTEIFHIPTPSPITPVRHEQADGCVMYMSLIVRRTDIPISDPGCVVALRLSTAGGSDGVKVSREQFADMSIIHEDFKLPHPGRVGR